MSSPPRPLSILILGAGIAGLTAAVALRRQGHHVTLLEKSTFHTETGAAMWVGPNVSGLLFQHLGLDLRQLGANPCLTIATYGADGTLHRASDTAALHAKWREPLLLTHRVDLHRELKRQATMEEGAGPAATLVLGAKVVEVDAEMGRVRLGDGRVFEGDLLVGADGNRSVARETIAPDARLEAWGKNAYRWITPKEVLVRDEETRGLVGGDGCYVDVADNDRKVVMYPCRDNTMINFAAFVPDGEGEGEGPEWDQRGDKGRMEAAFAGFFPAVRKALSYAGEGLKVWQMFDMKTLTHWTKGRLVLIGDAAHPFMPFLGQGGAMAIEDAASLGALLTPGTSSASIPELMKLFESIRKPRADHIQQQTRLQGLDEDKGKPPPSVLFAMLDYAHMFNEWENTSRKREEWDAQMAASRESVPADILPTSNAVPITSN